MSPTPRRPLTEGEERFAKLIAYTVVVGGIITVVVLFALAIVRIAGLI